MQTTQVTIAGQSAWAFDQGHAAGTFYTFDALDPSGAYEPHKVHVLAPRGWQSADRTWPLVVMFDGDTAFWPGGVGGKTWDVAGTLSRNRLPEAFVVAVVPTERDRQYTHVDWFDGRRPFGGLAEKAAWLANVLVPFLQQAFPLIDDPRARVVVGSSHGALAAFWTATRHPTVFGNAGCLSPSFFSGLDSFHTGATRAPLAQAPLVADVRPLLAGQAGPRPRLWIDWGMKRDGGEHNAITEAWAARRGSEMIDLLAHQLGYREQPFDAGTVPDPASELFTHVDFIGGHDEDAWRYRFGLLMRALLG